MQNEISELIDLINNRNIDKAFSQAKNIYETNKNNKQIVNILSFLYIQRGQFTSSIELLENYYTKHPNQKDFDYYANMGISLKSNEEFDKSIAMYNEAKKLNPGSPLCYIVPAEIYLKLRKFDLALELINLAIEKIELSENYKSIHFQNAIKIKTEINIALNRAKDNDELLSLIIGEKFMPDIFYLLALSNPKLVDTSLINKAENHLKIYDHSIQNSLDRFWKILPLYFGLAAAYSKKDKLKSEYFYHLANKETIKNLRYNSFDYQKQIMSIIDKYQNLSVLENNNKDAGKNNFFILGSPRSGTTLIESFIGSCEEVISGGELLSVPKLIEPYVQDKELPPTEKFIDNFVNTYLSRTDFIRQNYDYIVDKLPENFLYIGYLLKLMPQCKIIRTFRHPWDVAISLYKQRYVTNIPYSASFFNIGVFMANFEAINMYWDQQIHKDKKSHLLIDIRYEDLVANPSNFQKKIYNFLGLRSEFDENRRRAFFSQTASIRQISSPIHKDSLKKEEFIEHKQEFYDSFKMQRKYWQKKGIVNESDDFFGYKLD